MRWYGWCFVGLSCILVRWSWWANSSGRKLCVEETPGSVPSLQQLCVVQWSANASATVRCVAWCGWVSWCLFGCTARGLREGLQRRHQDAHTQHRCCGGTCLVQVLTAHSTQERQQQLLLSSWLAGLPAVGASCVCMGSRQPACGYAVLPVCHTGSAWIVRGGGLWCFSMRGACRAFSVRACLLLFLSPLEASTDAAAAATCVCCVLSSGGHAARVSSPDPDPSVTSQSVSAEVHARARVRQLCWIGRRHESLSGWTSTPASSSKR